MEDDLKVDEAGDVGVLGATLGGEMNASVFRAVNCISRDNVRQCIIKQTPAAAAFRTYVRIVCGPIKNKRYESALAPRLLSVASSRSRNANMADGS